MENTIQWYEIVNERGILQGDILENFELLVPLESEKESKIRGELQVYDCIVLTQSCDLENGKSEFVLLSPMVTLDQFKEAAPSDFFKSKKGLEQIRRGLIPGLHMLNSCDFEDYQRQIRIVDFHNLFSMPINYVMEYAEGFGDRLRLRSPYREHLSQSFARFFMRVGLPTNIPNFR